MSWYKTGTVTVTNGSATITGAGTLFVGAVQAGDAFVGPSREVYEVIEVISATQLTISPAYLGSSQPGATYGIFPTYAALVSFNTRLNTLLVNYEGVLTGAGAGKFLNGTAAAPGLSFVGDQDTGLYRAGANQLGASTGGDQRWLLSNTAFQVDVPITGSAVQSSPTDARAGRLLLAGAAGILGLLPVFTGNLDSQLNDIAPGFYNVPGTTVTGTVPTPFVNGLLHHSRRAVGGGEIQTLTIEDGAKNWTYIRSRAGGAWGPWSMQYAQNNILGTVTQTSGVPTGAVMEPITTNANGSYERLANGTQVCRLTFNLGSRIANGAGTLADPYRTATSNILFPAGFTAAPVIQMSCVINAPSARARAMKPSCATVTTTGMTTVQAVSPFDDTTVTDVILHVTARGRWD